MARMYTVSFDQVTLAAASGDYDLWELTPADDKPICIAGLEISNKSEIGEAQEEFIAYSIIRGNATSGSGGSAPTPARVVAADNAAGFTAETCNSTIASAGTAVSMTSATFNIRGGLDKIYPEQYRIWCTQADRKSVV